MALTTSALIAVAQQAENIIPTYQSMRGISDTLQAMKADYTLGTDTDFVAAMDLLYNDITFLFGMFDELETVVTLWETGTGTAGAASIDVLALTF